MSGRVEIPWLGKAGTEIPRGNLGFVPGRRGAKVAKAMQYGCFVELEEGVQQVTRITTF